MLVLKPMILGYPFWRKLRDTTKNMVPHFERINCLMLIKLTSKKSHWWRTQWDNDARHIPVVSRCRIRSLQGEFSSLILAAAFWSFPLLSVTVLLILSYKSQVQTNIVCLLEGRSCCFFFHLPEFAACMALATPSDQNICPLLPFGIIQNTRICWTEK